MTTAVPLLAGIVDYAGLFPPAAVGMATAVRNYAEYRADPASWMLGRFVLPVARLDEFTRAFSAITVREREPWRLSVLIGEDIAGGVEMVHGFNEAHDGRADADSIELRLTTAESIQSAARLARQFVAYVEIPVDPDPAPLVAAIADAGLKAKIRTGGLTADAFPAPTAIVRFMRRCLDAGVAFKATAGLHHPLRAEYPLTYADDAPVAPMYGYLNVFLAAALLRELSDEEAVALLQERDSHGIAVSAEEVRWRNHVISADAVTRVRNRFATSFGSCSFREPVDDLRALGLTQ